MCIIASIYDLLSLPVWLGDNKAKISRKKIRRLQNKYKGEKCFIVGNGPSLKKTDLSLLKKEYTFGLNRIYLVFEDLGFPTSFLASTNELVLEQCYKDFNKIQTIKFIGWKGRKRIKMDKETMFIRTLARQHFSKDVAKGVWEGATVTYVAMQIAYYLGFKKVILVGVDHNFKTKGRPHKEIVSQGDDKDHFSKDYFGKGFRWHLADLDTAEYAFRIAKEAYEESGREIVDATIGGKLRVFKKVNYLNLFKHEKNKEEKV